MSCVDVYAWTDSAYLHDVFWWKCRPRVWSVSAELSRMQTSTGQRGLLSPSYLHLLCVTIAYCWSHPIWKENIFWTMSVTLTSSTIIHRNTRVKLTVLLRKLIVDPVKFVSLKTSGPKSKLNVSWRANLPYISTWELISSPYTFHSMGRWGTLPPRGTRSSATAKRTARPSCLVGILDIISQERIDW